MSSDGPGQGTITSRPVLPPPPPAFGRWRHALRAAGLAAGLGAVVLMAPVLRPAPGPLALPLSVNANVARSGEVGLLDGTQLLSTAPVRPGAGGAATGSVQVESQTWAPVLLRVRDTGPATGIEDDVHLRVALGGTVLFDGRRAQLRAADSQPTRLEPRQRGELEVTASLADGAESYRGRTADITLTISSTRAEED